MNHDNPIDTLFRRQPRGILSVYFTAGHPRPDSLPAIVRALQDGGASMIEIGIPFSDPIADGPVIQQSSADALRGGMTLPLLFDQLASLRGQLRVPVLLMGYLNPIMQYGFERFCRQCRGVGVAGMIIPDLPFRDYLRHYKPVADAGGLRMIMLVTPATSDERVRLIDAHTDGFIYLVSTASTTGARDRFDDDTRAYFRRIREMNPRNPLLVGFGIANKSTLDDAFAHASGAIVGSKFVSLLADSDTPEDAVKKLFLALATG
ncbi:MAG: tryptophan synthase subunit alpha [Odoribacteraceae bacterium]|jgi:tryptophan synthase alpha chain|nr:tryptophan synthase subunit alpha [Odoribacteraceae bacterium]